MAFAGLANQRQMSTAFAELLAPQRLTEIVDIGANPIGGEPPYAGMLSAGLCRVTGFEPQKEALLELQRKKGPHERYLAHAIGDGAAHTLNICIAPGMSSLLEPDPAMAGLFDGLKPFAEVKQRVPVQTRRLDDIAEIGHLDFLKIDIQGGELAVFEGGRRKLAHAAVVQTKISFVTLYRNQPHAGEIDLELRKQGFIPHCFAALKTWPLAPRVSNRSARQPYNQLLEADLVYVRDFSRPQLMGDEQLKHLALIAHHCYGSLDLALRCVLLLDERQSLKPGAQQRYLQLLNQMGSAVRASTSIYR